VIILIYIRSVLYWYMYSYVLQLVNCKRRHAARPIRWALGDLVAQCFRSQSWLFHRSTAL